MTIEIHNIQRLRLWTESSFATDGTGTLANYTDVPAIEGSINATLGQDMLDPAHLQQHLDGYPTQVLGRKMCTLSFSMNLAPTGTAATDGVAQVQGVLGEILAAVLGGENLGTGDADQAGASTSTSLVTAAASSRNLDDGAAVGCNTGASSAYEMREIQVRSSNTLTLKLALTGAPSSGADVHAAATYYLAQNPTTSLQCILEGAEQDDRWLFMGLQLESLAIDTPINQLPRITFNLKGVQWLHGDDTAGVLTGSALGIASYSNIDVVNVDGEFRVVTAGVATLTGSLIEISQVTLTPNVGYIEIPSPSGTNGVYSWRRTRNAPAMRLSFRTFFEDEDWNIVRNGQQLQAIFWQINNTAGSSILLSVPTAQVVDVQRIDVGGQAGQEVTCVALLDTDVTGTTDLAKSPFRIHLG